MSKTDEYDWIFDFTLQFLESESFDASIMDFVDEKCFVFDDEEENKLVYTEIHREFCTHVEALINSNLGELGITSEMFLESCTKAKDSRDINSTVFERLIAMDDFQTFKKIMCTRNTELQMESIQQLQAIVSSSRGGGRTAPGMERGMDAKGSSRGAPTVDTTVANALLDPEELRRQKEEEDDFLESLDKMPEEEIQELLFQSLMEMELIHRQEELEHAELERALQMSLLAEEERLRQLMSEETGASRGFGCMSPDAKRRPSTGSVAEAVESKPSQVRTLGQLGLLDIDSKPSTSVHSSGSKTVGGGAKEASSSKDISPSTVNNETAATAGPPSEPKTSSTKLEPLALKPLSGFRAPLPAIGLGANLDEKKRVVEDVLKQGQQQLASQRKQEENLRQQVAGIDPVEAEKRAAYMREQRDRLLAMKKAEREKKVAAETEKKAKMSSAGESPQPPKAVAELIQRNVRDSSTSTARADAKGQNDEANAEAEARRSDLRNALARRMKLDLLEKEEEKFNAAQEQQFTALDKRLQQVEQTREDNRKREYILCKQIERQKAYIAKNIQMSAASLNQSDGFDA